VRLPAQPGKWRRYTVPYNRVTPVLPWARPPPLRSSPVPSGWFLLVSPLPVCKSPAVVPVNFRVSPRARGVPCPVTDRPGVDPRRAGILSLFQSVQPHQSPPFAADQNSRQTPSPVPHAHSTVRTPHPFRKRWSAVKSQHHLEEPRYDDGLGVAKGTNSFRAARRLNCRLIRADPGQPPHHSQRESNPRRRLCPPRPT